MDIVITGGIATGKSAFVQEILRLVPDFGFFDCDKAVHVLLTEPQILESLRRLFGERVFDRKGISLNRSVLRRLVFNEQASRRNLEGILHPAVRERFIEKRTSYFETSPHGVFIADVPLFYETNATYPHDLVVVVATTPATQIQRLMNRSPHIVAKEAQSIISAQTPIMQKALRADVVAWNEGPRQILSDQAALLLEAFDRSTPSITQQVI